MKSICSLRVRLGSGVLMGILSACAGRASAQTYYVSPTGSDNNSGLNPSQPWASLSKVDSTDFAPGSSILFQDGGNWTGTLVATSSGTTSQPITYSSYGSGASPTIWGSNVLNAANFQQVAGTPSSDPTYDMNYSTTVNSFLEDHQFMHDATLTAPNSATDTPANFESYVESTPDSWYYNGGQLFVNSGTTISPSDGHTYSAAVYQNLVDATNVNNVVFNNFTTRESAAPNGGYGFNVNTANNITIENSTAIAAGKHAFGVIGSNNFLGQNLSASYTESDLGYGNATAFVAYSGVPGAADSSTWVNCSYTNPNGPYASFISHSVTGNDNAIASVTLVNVSGPGITIYPSSPTEQVSITGGQLTGQNYIGTNNTVVNGVNVSGQLSYIQLAGNNDVIQNSVFTGSRQYPQGGQNGAVYVTGQNDTVRYNDLIADPTSALNMALLGLASTSGNTAIYGNIFVPNGGGLIFNNLSGSATVSSNNNLFAQVPVILNSINLIQEPYSQWQLTDGQDLNSIVGNPMFVDAADGDYYLLPGSPALGAFVPNAQQWVPTDYMDDADPALGLAFDLGAVQSIPEPAALAFVATMGLVALRRPKSKLKTLD